MSVTLPTPPLGTQLTNPDGTPSEAYNRFFLSIDTATATFAPNEAEYFVSRANPDLPNEVNLGALASGYMKLTVAASIATPSTVTTIPIADLTGVLPAANGGTGTATPTGTYTPTATLVVNVASATFTVCQWMRVSDMVTVSGSVSITPSGAGTCQLYATLPIASALTANAQLGGAGASTLGGVALAIEGRPASDEAHLWLTAPDATGRTFPFSFNYRVI